MLRIDNFLRREFEFCEHKKGAPFKRNFKFPEHRDDNEFWSYFLIIEIRFFFLSFLRFLPLSVVPASESSQWCQNILFVSITFWFDTDTDTNTDTEQWYFDEINLEQREIFVFTTFHLFIDRNTKTRNDNKRLKL